MNPDWMTAFDRPRKAEPDPRPVAEWFRNLGLTGKLIVAGALAGVIASFLPLVRGDDGLRLVGDWRGVLSLLGYLAAGGLAVVLYLPGGTELQRELAKGAVAAGGVVLLLAVWLLIVGWRTGAFGVGFNLAAALTVAVGVVRKGIEENVFVKQIKL